MPHRALSRTPSTWLRSAVVALAACSALACGEIEIPQVLALVGDNSIGISLASVPPPFNELSTTLEGGVDTTILVDLGSLFNLGGIPASIVVEDLLIAGDPILVLGGLVNTGVLCISQDPDLMGGGMAFIRPFKGELDLTLALDTIVNVTDPDLITFLNLDPLPFGALIEAQIPLSLADLLGLFFGTGGGGFEVTQTISDTLPDDIELFGGAELSATLTLASVDALPSSDNLTFCEGFLAGP